MSRRRFRDEVSESWPKRLSMITSDIAPARRIRLRAGQPSPVATFPAFCQDMSENGYRGSI